MNYCWLPCLCYIIIRFDSLTTLFSLQCMYKSVAILAKNGVCSVETKARLASLSVEPPGRLKYLIVYGDNIHVETPLALRPLDRDPEITVGILHVDESSGRGTFVHPGFCVFACLTCW